MKKLLLSILILTSTSLYAQCQGDMNDDGIKNVIDIITLVNQIIAGDTECEEQDVHGCLDSQACNYDSGALIDNNSCYYCYNDDCDTYPQDHFDCDGICLFEVDCLGVCNGNAVVDECGVCEGDGVIEGFDCNGNCIAGVDSCGVCGGDDLNEDGYHCGDYQVLEDFIDVNPDLTGYNPLDICYQITWNGDGRLTTLKCSNGDVEYVSIPQSIGNLSQLDILDLYECSFTEIPDEVTNLINLTNLGFSANPISSLPNDIGNLTNLNILGIYNMNLTSVPESIYNLTDTIIMIQGNQLCEEYNNEVFDTYWGNQDQSNCCEGPNGEPNWTTCP